MARGRKSVTIRDVAADAGVSLQTVSRVINDGPNVRPQMRDKVRVVIAAQACLLILGMDHDWYQRVRTILVYRATGRFPIRIGHDVCIGGDMEPGKRLGKLSVELALDRWMPRPRWIHEPKHFQSLEAGLAERAVAGLVSGA